MYFNTYFLFLWRQAKLRYVMATPSEKASEQASQGAAPAAPPAKRRRRSGGALAAMGLGLQGREDAVELLGLGAVAAATAPARPTNPPGSRVLLV